MAFKFNPLTGNLDLINDSSLHLDQTTAQHIINGSPNFDEGLTIKKDKPLYLDG